MSAKWSSEQIPDQSGRTAIVTGANSGLGLVTATELARHGASVVLACRNVEKGEAALAEITASAPGAQLELAGSTSAAWRPCRHLPSPSARAMMGLIC